jgi:hypothetical protein
MWGRGGEAGSLAGAGPSSRRKGRTRRAALVVDIHDVLEKLFCWFCFALSKAVSIGFALLSLELFI